MDRILGADRAIPENYRHAKINEARIDWLSGGSNYREVVTKAANEAGGQAFVTDYAGKSEIMDLGILDGKRHNTEKISKLTDPVAFLRAIQEDGYFLPGSVDSDPVPVSGTARSARPEPEALSPARARSAPAWIAPPGRPARSQRPSPLPGPGQPPRG